ncbi:MAG: hypothetical protein AAGJ18_28230 [Bacteroidota bacterium]
MPRFHLIEFEDQQWFPKTIRNYMTDFLQFVTNQFNLFKASVPILEKGLAKSGGSQIIDLASGGGGAWLKLVGHLQQKHPDIQVKLTDYFPNHTAFEKIVAKGDGHFSFEEESVNALEVPPHLKGFRTQFLSFHHFKPEDAQQILQNAVDHQSVIGIFEGQKRSVAHFIQFFFSPINVLLMTPFIRPFSLGRIIFTYLIPIVPIFVWWDGLVSVLRTYSVKEMRTMTKALKHGNNFEWEIGEVKNGPVTNLYLLGYPKKENTSKL